MVYITMRALFSGFFFSFCFSFFFGVSMDLRSLSTKMHELGELMGGLVWGGSAFLLFKAAHDDCF
jgi:hypothetical protein